MAKKKKSKRGENSSFDLFIPTHNALGTENWPHYVQDEKERLSERRFSSNEEWLVAGLDGQPLFNIFDTISQQDVLDPVDAVLYAALNYDQEQVIDDRACSFLYLLCGYT